MKCFYDHSQDAVGACKSCGKGLSMDHAVDLGKGLACRGRCEEDVRLLISLIDNNVAMRAASKKIVLGSGRAGMISSLFQTLIGLVFLIYGIVMWERHVVNFTIFIGLIFLVSGLLSFYRSYSIQRTITETRSDDV